IQLPPGSTFNRKRGKELLRERGCANCHDSVSAGIMPLKLRPAPAADTLTKGCLAAKPQAAPDFGLTDTQRKALVAFLKTDGQSLKRETPAEVSRRQVKDLNCQACHRRDGQNSTWNQILEEEALQPEF